jgi:general secretion pathway protein B
VSLILDALNRSREDANPVPGLTTHHSVEQVAVNRRQYLLWVALSVAVIVIAWLFMERYSAPQQSAREPDVSVAESSTNTDGGAVDGVGEIREQAVVAEQAAPSIVASSAPAAEIITPALVNLESAPVESTTVASATGLEESPPLEEDLSSEMVQRSASTVIAQSDLVPTSAPPANDAVAQLYANPDLAEEPVIRKTQRRSAGGVESADEPIDVDTIIKLAREEVKNAGLIDNSVPLLKDLSQQFKDTVPSVYYLRHDYSSNVSRSTVVLNSKTLSVGGSPAAGMKVEEILPDSVVLNYQGTQFRLRALNSWINL